MSQKQVLFFVLEKTEVLDELLISLNDAGIHGATVINSTGMAQTLASREDDYSFGTFRDFFRSDRVENKTIFTIIDEQKIPVAKKVINEVVGDLNKPYKGILFAFPVSFVEGISD